MRVNAVDLYVEDRGDGPPVLFSHGLLWSGRMYAPQVAALCDSYRCITYDHRGQGKSEVPAGDCIDLETLTADAIGLIEALDIGPCHFVGLSMGGFVGQRIAARRPELLRSLTLLATAADPEPEANRPKYRTMNAVVKLGGARLVAPRVSQIMFGKSFLMDTSRAEERARLTNQLATLPKTIYKAVNGIIDRSGVEAELKNIEKPTLIIRGDEDAAIARERTEAMHQGIRGSTFVPLRRGGHTLTLEEPALVNHHLRQFLDAREAGASGAAE